MWVATTKGEGILFMVLALLMLGTWPALFNLVERRGRLPTHTFLDYAITNYIVAIVVALTLGQIGSSTPETPNFTTQLKQNNGPSVGFAVAGGVFLCIGNLLTQYALAFVGLSVTETVESSITVVMGTTLNFFLDGRINKAEILFPGVACFLFAAILGSFTHASNKDDHDKTLGITRGGNFIEKSINRHSETGAGVTLTPPLGYEMPNKEPRFYDEEDGTTKVLPAAAPGGTHAAGSKEYLEALEDKRAIKITGKSTFIGLAILVCAGISYGVFSPAFNLASNDQVDKHAYRCAKTRNMLLLQWHKLDEGVPHLVIYTAFFYFSTGFFVLAFILNITFLYYPPFGLPKSSIGAWINDWPNRHWALLAGVICGFGNTFQFMGGQAAGYAAADSVQALPLVSTFWGIVLFGEYRRCSKRTFFLLIAMLCAFAAAVGLLMGSSGHRKTD